jgi:hypothetical protein
MATIQTDTESRAMVVQQSRISEHDIEIPSPWRGTQFPACLHIICVCCSTTLGPSSRHGNIDLLIRTAELYPIHIISGIARPLRSVFCMTDGLIDSQA